jgi:hypothetical protein
MYSALKKERLACSVLFIIFFVLMLDSLMAVPILAVILYILEAFRWETPRLSKFPEGQQVKFYTIGCALILGWFFSFLI